MIQPNTVITGDSLTVLRSMDDESADSQRSKTTRPRSSGGSTTPPES